MATDQVPAFFPKIQTRPRVGYLNENPRVGMALGRVPIFFALPIPKLGYLPYYPYQIIYSSFFPYPYPNPTLIKF